MAGFEIVSRGEAIRRRLAGGKVYYGVLADELSLRDLAEMEDFVFVAETAVSDTGKGAPPTVKHEKDKLHSTGGKGSRVDIEKAKSLRAAGWSWPKIGDEFGVSAQAVLSAVARAKEAGADGRGKSRL